ncbi:WD40 repeat domain-containing protein [Actinomadura viridis]
MRPPHRRQAVLRAGAALALPAGGLAWTLPAPPATASTAASTTASAGTAAAPRTPYTGAYTGTGAGARAQRAAPDDEIAFTVSDPRITESSGLAVSRRHRGVTYTHNDSGGVAQIFALGPDGRTRAVLTLAGAGARDWEAMAMGRDEQGRPAIFVADIGDNLGGAWPYVTVYRVTEPERLRTRTLRATAFRFKYEDGPRNAETMMINPRTNRLYIASKLFSAAVYEAPARLSTRGTNLLRKVGDAPAIATDGAFAPDGSGYAIRTYFGARLYRVDAKGRPGRMLTSIGLPRQQQGESLTYSADGRSLLVGSEGPAQAVYRVPLPKDALPSPGPSGSSRNGDGEGNGGGAGSAEEGRRDSTGPSLGLIIALSIAAAVGYGLLRRRS